MNRVYNTSFEISLRILLLLSEANEPMDVERIYVADFISTYGREFSVSETNVNGDNAFMFSEFSARRELAAKAAKDLVLRGYIKPLATNNGMLYQITSLGLKHASLLSSGYSVVYREAARGALEYMDSRTIRSIIRDINLRARRSAKDY